MLYIEPVRTREQILYHAKHQFEDGDVLHWWHVERDNGIRTRYTDDMLWLPYVLCEYISKTEDYAILDEMLPYVEMEQLRDGENERYSEVAVTQKADSLYAHACKAIDKSLSFRRERFAEHGHAATGTTA